MFQRQWFEPFSHQGLNENLLKSDIHLQNQEFLQSYCELLKEAQSNKSPYIIRKAKSVYRASIFSGKLLRVSCTNFWEGFNLADSLIFYLISKAAENSGLTCIAVDKDEPVDIMLFSCFGTIAHDDTQRAILNIIYLGENVRPEYTTFDYSISSDAFEYCGKNIYLPVWLDYIFSSRNEKSTKINAETALNDLYVNCLSKSQKWESRSDRIVLVANNMTPLRKSLVSYLKASGIKINIYGSHFNPIADKVELYGKHKFVLCPENSLFNGYSTEKFLEPALCNCYLIHWGFMDKEIASSLSARLISINSEKQVVDQILNLTHKSPDFNANKVFDTLLTKSSAIMKNGISRLEAILSSFRPG